MKRAATVLLVLACGCCEPATASPLLPPSALVPHLGDLRGFGPAKVLHFSTTSVSEWVQANSNTKAEATQEASELTQGGFQLGVQAAFLGQRESHGKRREAVADAVVLSTTTAAEHSLSVQVAGFVKVAEKQGLKRGTVRSIPGSVTLGSFVRGKRGATGNVFFSVGRCLFVVGDVVHDAPTRAAATKPSIAAATAVYKRAKPSCL